MLSLDRSCSWRCHDKDSKTDNRVMKKGPFFCAFLVIFAAHRAPLGAATAPVINTQPQNTNVNCGLSGTFSVTASGASSYQWLKNGSSISGATVSFYNTPPASAADNGAQFKVILS